MAKAKSSTKSKTVTKKTAKKPIKAVVKEKIKKVVPKSTESEEDQLAVTIEKKLIILYTLQQIESQIDKIRIIRGELPLEVQDLEDEIAGLETRIENFVLEIEELEKKITEKNNSINESLVLKKKYEDQQMNVRNNREYDSLSKEIEFQSLEIQLSEKYIKEFDYTLGIKKEDVEKSKTLLEEKNEDLVIKNDELGDIVAETEKEENDLLKKSEKNKNLIEERLLTAYSRIRKNARNGLAVVPIERDACGGCFNKIPPQHQLDIRMHKKIIVCEYCGRILIDDNIAEGVKI